MNPRLEWAVPLAVGIAFGLGLWALTAGSDGGGDGEAGTGGTSTSTTPEPSRPLLLPFGYAEGTANGTTTFLVLAPLGKAPFGEAVNGSRAADEWGRLTWQSDRVALYAASNAWAGCDGSVQPPRCVHPSWEGGDWPLPRALGVRDDVRPRLMEDGYNATRVTAFVFDEAGLLLASNADASDIARFTKHDDYLRLQESAWYLGDNATAPNGTARLPAFAQPLVDRVMEQLDGLPVGGVASTRSNAYVALYGSLFVTIRVDDLVHAP